MTNKQRYAERIRQRLDNYISLIEKRRKYIDPEYRSKSGRLSELYVYADREIVRLKELGAIKWDV